jgi:hypothetical protein
VPAGLVPVQSGAPASPAVLDGGNGLGVAGGGLGVLAGQVAVLAEAGPDPGVFQVLGAWHLPQLGQGNVGDHLGVGAGPVRDQARTQEELAGELKGVMKALALGTVVFRARLLAQGLQDRADGGGALRGQVPADHRRAAERRPDLEVAVIEAIVRVVRVRLLLAPFLDGAGRDRRQVIQ